MQKLGVFWKMVTEIFKIEEEMTEKMKPKVLFAFWMSLKVVMAVFPLNDIFWGHLVHSIAI